MIPVKVDQVFLSNAGFVVILRSASDPRALPIFVGQAEAEAIMLKLKNVPVPRPLTHDLLKNLLDYLECRLTRIEIFDIKEEVFYARLILVVDNREVAVDSRPSDAIALALRMDAPLFVSAKVMNDSGRIVQVEDKDGGESQEPQSVGPAEKSRLAKPTSPEDALSGDLLKAVAEERYEDAARIRDAMKKLKESHAGN